MRKTIPFIALAALLGGCSDFIEVPTPTSQLATTAVFADVSTAEAAMAAIYARVREEAAFNGGVNGSTYLLANYADDMRYYGTNADILQFADHTLQPANGMVAGMWNAAYGIVYSCNALLEGLGRSTAISASDKDRLRGEALFIRGFTHFFLANAFGDVPYVVGTDYRTNASIPKSPASGVMRMALADVLEAKTLLGPDPVGPDRVRVNRVAAVALAARMHLYLEEWEQAAAAATEVLAAPGYAWTPNVSNEFLRGATSTIWSLHPGIEGVNTQEARTFVFTAAPTRAALTDAFVSGFEPGDLRRADWIRTVTVSAGTFYASNKYKRTTSTTPSMEYTIVLRLAEQYLVRAEARAHLGDVDGARADLDVIRVRAGLGGTPATTTASLLQALEVERRHELFSEWGHRWFDLKRTGRAGAVMSAVEPNWKATDVLLPLPEKELRLNPKLEPQNPGYE